jgi:hypothetical protein
MPGCIAIPRGIVALRDLLVRLDAQELGRRECLRLWSGAIAPAGARGDGTTKGAHKCAAHW